MIYLSPKISGVVSTSRVFFWLWLETIVLELDSREKKQGHAASIPTRSGSKIWLLSHVVGLKDVWNIIRLFVSYYTLTEHRDRSHWHFNDILLLLIKANFSLFLRMHMLQNTQLANCCTWFEPGLL